MKVTMTYNPSCGTARNVLALLQERSIEPEIIEYLKTPLTRDQISALVKKMGVPVRDVVRAKEKLYSELKLENSLSIVISEKKCKQQAAITTTE
jgi:arsenate reductase